MFYYMDGLTWSGLGFILVSALFSLHFHIELRREQSRHKETQKVLVATRTLLRLISTATTPGSATVIDHYEAFLALVPSGDPRDIGSDFPCREVTRIRYKCEAREFLGDLYTLRQSVQPGTDNLHAVANLKRSHSTGAVSFAELAERILAKLKVSMRTGCFDYADIGTSEREMGEIIAMIVRHSGKEVVKEVLERQKSCEEEVASLRRTAERLSEKFGANFLPILETALAQKTSLEPGKEGEAREAQA